MAGSNQKEGLAERLDRELEEHIQSVVEKNKDYKYEDGLTMENLDEQLRRIPLFCNEQPTQEDIDNSPAWTALQALKYQDEDPHECSLAHKEDGNYHFQRKDYEKAILAYTEGLRSKHEDSVLYAVLYTNRAAANFYMGNNRSALDDAIWALKCKPDHSKAFFRCAVCCFDLEKYDDCMDWCDRGLTIDINDKKLLEMKKKAAHQKKQKERDRRKSELKKVKNLAKRNKLLDAIEARNINMKSSDCSVLRADDLLLDTSGMHSGKIYLDENEALHWPVYFLYPEYNQSDFIEDFEENTSFLNHLMVMFEELPEWDIEKKYSVDNIEVYFEDKERCKAVHVDPNLTLREVLSDGRYTLYGGCPALMILSRKTDFYKQMFAIQDWEEFK